MYRYNYSMNGKTQKVEIRDAAGQESFYELHLTFYFVEHVCILVFDANHKVTYYLLFQACVCLLRLLLHCQACCRIQHFRIRHRFLSLQVIGCSVL